MTTRRSPKKADKRRAWFKWQLDQVGETYQSIADRVGGITRQAVRQSILNPSPRVADVISEVLGKEKSELWPARYKEPRYSKSTANPTSKN